MPDDSHQMLASQLQWEGSSLSDKKSLDMVLSKDPATMGRTPVFEGRGKNKFG